MDSDPLAVVRSAYEAFNRSDLDAVIGVIDPELEVHDPGRTGRIFHGPEGYLEFIGEWLESWDDYKVEIRDLTANGDKVLVDLVQTGRGKGSGVELSESVWQVLTIRDGKIAHFQVFIERDDARRAAGLTD